MTPQTIQLMAQLYQESIQEPLILPATIETISWAYHEICAGEDPWTALGNFTNAWYGYAKSIRPDLVREALVKPEQETEHTHRWGAFCAASIEFLCDRYQVPCPDWVHDPYYTLETPWWHTRQAQDPSMREYLVKVTPEPFARRNIFCTNRLFQNKYEHHLTDPPPPLREKLPTIAAEVEQVVMTALAKDPKQRFASVQAFATALEQASQPMSPIVLATPPHRSAAEPIMSPANRSSAFEQANQPEQSPPSLSLPVTTPPSQPLPATVLAAPLNHIRELTTQDLPPSYALHPFEVSGTQLPMPQPTSHLSRRMVIAGLVGLTLVGSGIIWFAASRSSTSKPTLRMTPTSPTPTPLPMGTILYTYKGHADSVLSVTWSPDGKRIASASYDKTVQVWDATDGSNVFTYKGHSSSVLSVAWSPDGKRIASASVDHTVQVWDTTNGSHVFTYNGHADTVWSVAWSPDGKRIASASYDKTVQVWDATDGSHVFTYKGHSSSVESVAWSPNGKHITSGSYDKTVQVWDATDGSHVFTYNGHSDTVWSVAWSPNGKQRIASGSSDHTVQVWDATDGSHVFTYNGHSDWVHSVAWSSDGKRIASGSYDYTVQVWDAADGSNIYTYRGHSSFARSVAWSPDGKRIASGSADNTVQVWVAS